MRLSSPRSPPNRSVNSSAHPRPRTPSGATVCSRVPPSPYRSASFWLEAPQPEFAFAGVGPRGCGDVGKLPADSRSFEDTPAECVYRLLRHRPGQHSVGGGIYGRSENEGHAPFAGKGEVDRAPSGCARFGSHQPGVLVRFFPGSRTHRAGKRSDHVRSSVPTVAGRIQVRAPENVVPWATGGVGLRRLRVFGKCDHPTEAPAKWRINLRYMCAPSQSESQCHESGLSGNLPQGGRPPCSTRNTVTLPAAS